MLCVYCGLLETITVILNSRCMAWAASAVLLVACGDHPRRIVVRDDAVESVVLEGLNALEDRSGCQLFSGIGGGVRRDWKGRKPSFGVVTVEVCPDLPAAGRTLWWPHRARICLRSLTEGSAVTAHELLHALGVDHRGEPGELMHQTRNGTTIGWRISSELQKEIQSLCL